jgi:hypothetical protein
MKNQLAIRMIARLDQTCEFFSSESESMLITLWLHFSSRVPIRPSKAKRFYFPPVEVAEHLDFRNHQSNLNSFLFEIIFTPFLDSVAWIQFAGFGCAIQGILQPSRWRSWIVSCIRFQLSRSSEIVASGSNFSFHELRWLVIIEWFPGSSLFKMIKR